MQSKQSWNYGIKIALAYIGTVIGAGFATGQEILQFFTRYGYNSVLAILLSTVLFIVVGRKILLMGNRLGAESYGSVIDQMFGAVSPLVNIYLAISYMLTLGAMFAGAGAMLNEQFGMPYLAGALITAGISLAVTLYGVRGILASNSVIAPSIITFNLVILAYVLFSKSRPAGHINITPGQLLPLLKTGITYASFNLILSVGVLAPMGGAVRDVKSLYIGSLLGGGLLGLLLLTGNYSMLQYTPEVFDREIPLMLIVGKMGRVLLLVYGLIIWLEILSTAIGNLFSINTVVREKLKVKSNIPALIITLVGFLICTLGFSNIVQWFYPALGIIGFILVGMILLQA